MHVSDNLLSCIVLIVSHVDMLGRLIRVMAQRLYRAIVIDILARGLCRVIVIRSGQSDTEGYCYIVRAKR